MSSDGIAVRVEGVSKVYNLYDSPRDRLKQFLLPRVPRLLGRRRQVYYREFWALRDVSFEVKRGEAVGIVGRNGSGKSTLLQIIAGTLTPTKGNVSVYGRVAGLLELGAGFNPEFTGRENVFMSGALLGLDRKEIEARFDDIAAFADIGGYLDQPIRTYSSGMLVRLAFAVHVQLQPDILIVDEALAVGDALFQKRCFSKIASLREQGVTLLFVSHDQEIVRTLTDRALLLRNGRVAAYGPSTDVIFAYRQQLHEEEVYSSSGKSASQRISVISSDSESGVYSFRREQEKLKQFGTYDIEVRKVEIFGENSEPKSVFYPGDRQEIRITLFANKDAERLNVFIRIRNKEGVKIYSWGTLNQDRNKRRAGALEDLFWKKRFVAGQAFTVRIFHDCPLGPNFYEVQAGVALEKDMDYGEQTVLHWVDEAAFFTVAMNRSEYFFGGVADLRATAEYS